jgi:hypothetical protein
MKSMKLTPTAESAWICLAILVVVAAGCGAPKASDFKPSKIFSMTSVWPWSDGPDHGTPLRVAGTWTDTVLHRPGQKPQRGFGGRLVFYGPDEKKPILVDGQLVVYAFDETGRDPTNNRPTRRYVFPPDQMPLHMSVSEIGASYSFWLPWDEGEGPRTEVSLICRFEPKGGAVISSEQTRHLLPGALPPAVAAGQPPPLPEGVASRPARPTLESLMQARPIHGGTQLASYETQASAGAEASQTQVQTTSLVPERRMSVTSIRLPNDYQLPAANAQFLAAPTSPGQAAPAAAAPRIVPQIPPQVRASQQPAGQNTQPTNGNSATGAASGRPAISIRQTLPTTPPQTQGAFSSPQLARPQLIAPQFMSLEPRPVSTGAPATLNLPPSAPAMQPASR